MIEVDVMSQNMQVRQISQEEVDRARGVKQQMTPEELQRTQVLNLQDVEDLANFEKRTSKKPAIIIGILGIISILCGGGLTAYQSMAAKAYEAESSKKVEKREIQNKVEEKPAATNVSCTYETKNNGDGTDTLFTVNYNFIDGELTGFTKQFDIVAIPGNPNGNKGVLAYVEGYKPYTVAIDGYSVVVTYDNSSKLTAITTVDFDKLDMTKFPQFQQSHFTTSIDYTMGTPQENVYSSLISKGFQCK
jgi:hypothetical protein